MTIDEQINEKLAQWGISKTFTFEDEDAKKAILRTITAPMVKNVYIDEESHNLCVDFHEFD